MKQVTVLSLIVWLLLVLPINAQTPQEPPAPKPSAAVQQLVDEAVQLLQAKSPQESLAASDRALRAAKGAQDWAGQAAAQRARARVLEKLGPIEEAAATWREAARAWERVSDGPGQIEALAAAGLLLVSRIEMEANQLFEQAVAVGQAESKRPLAAAQALHTAGTAVHGRGRLAPARAFFSAAFAIREKLAPNSLEVAASMDGLGAVARDQGELTTAVEYHQRALAIQQRLSPDSLTVATTLHNLGRVAHEQGDMDAAAEHIRHGLIIRERLAPHSLDMATSLNGLCDVLWHLGDLMAAQECGWRGLAIRELLAPDSVPVALSLTNLGVVVKDQGDLAAARQYYRRALSIWEKLAPDSLDVARSLHNLGDVARDQGDFAVAAEYYRRALIIKEKLAPDSLTVATSLNNLGNVARDQGDLRAAEVCHQRALTIREKLSPDSLAVAESLEGLGDVAHDQGDLAAAERHYQRALAIREKLAPHALTTAENLHKLGLVAQKQGNLDKAERLAHQVWGIIRQQGAAISGDEARQAFGASTAKHIAALVQLQQALGKTRQAFLTLEEGRAQALHQLLNERRLVTSAVDEKLWSAYRAAVAARDRAEAEISRASATEAKIQQELTAARQQGGRPEALERIQTALQAAIKQFEDAQSAYTLARVKADQEWTEIKKRLPRLYAPPLTLEQAQHSLPPGALFVSFSTDEEKTVVFLLRSSSGQASEAESLGSTGKESERPLSAYAVEIPLDQLQRLVDRFRVEVNTRSRRTARAMAGRLLFAKLFPTEARPLIDRAQRVLISPDGPLWDVPFAALVTNAVGPPHYLGADKPITYTQSLTLFAQARNDAPQLAQGGTAHALVVGHPVFDRTSTEGARPKTQNSRLKTQVQDPKRTTQPLRTFTSERSYLFINGQPPEPLPETKTEAMEIAKLYGGEFLIEKQATEAAVRERIGQADVIHLATHGYLNPVRAMSSGVLLTAPETEPDLGQTANDGALQAWEIYSQLKLKAELVVLSACETGRGQKVRGEGLVGLTRALQYAGARSMVASQWKVSDKSTADLMVAFHQFLRQGMAKDDALRQAMETVRRQKRTAHPYFWAAFVLIGDPDNPHLGVEEVNQ
jgi:CHAT domain-containing protein